MGADPRTGPDAWNKVMDTLLERKFVLDPTFTAYLTSRDFMRTDAARAGTIEYTMPALWDYYRRAASTTAPTGSTGPPAEMA